MPETKDEKLDLFKEKWADVLFPKKRDVTSKEVIIYAPHPDDEIIGCYEILTNPVINPIII
jgi:hypothetical protein